MTEPTTPTEPFVFNWQTQGEDSFLRWMIPNLMVQMDDQVMDQLRVRTDLWTNITLTMQVNGVEIPVDNFIAGIEHNLTYNAHKEAARLLASIPRLEKLREAMDEADFALRQRLAEILAEAGVHLEESAE